MIEILQAPETRPITSGEVAMFLGLPSGEPEPLADVILAGAIFDVERALGIGIGVSQVRVTVYWPIPSRLLLPYSPVVVDDDHAFQVSVIDEITGNETILETTSYLLRQRIPAELLLLQPVVASGSALRVSYYGGHATLPEHVKQLLLRTCAARWQSRSTDIQPEVCGITDEAYLRCLR